MLQLNIIRDNKEFVIERLKIKNFKNAEQIIEEIISLDNKRRDLQKMSDECKQKQNILAKQIGSLFKEGKKEEAEEKKQETSTLKAEEKDLTDKLSEADTKIKALLLSVPNLPHQSVKPGKGEEDNEVVEMHGEIPNLNDKALPH